MILAAVVIARNPAQYGFDLSPQPDQSALAAGGFAAHCGVGRHDHRRDSVPQPRSCAAGRHPFGTVPCACPRGPPTSGAARIEDTPSTELASLNWYVVRRATRWHLSPRSFRRGPTSHRRIS